MRYRRFARAVFGREELEQIERVAEWRGRAADWEIVDELRRQLGSARNGKSRPRLRPFDYGHAEDDLVSLKSDQFTGGISYDINERIRIGAGAQYVDRETLRQRLLARWAG